MSYNFDEIIDRRDTGSLKWHYTDDTIPLWVADMDFKAAQPILDAVEQVTQHGILGYTKPTEALYQSIIDWHGSRTAAAWTETSTSCTASALRVLSGNAFTSECTYYPGPEIHNCKINSYSDS